MANLFIGFNVGADYSPDKATTGAATGGTDVELRIDLSKFDEVTKRRIDISQILEAIENVIEDERNFGVPS